MSAVADLLRQAADHIEAVGLEQSGLYFRDATAASTAALPLEQRPCCAIGALSVVGLGAAGSADMVNPSDPCWNREAETTAEGRALVREAMDALNAWLVARDLPWITAWSDEQSDPSVVPTTMRRVADELEGSAA